MTEDIRDDLAYVRALAEEGRDTPLVNGLTYLIWGLLIAAAAFLSYGDNMGWLNLGSLGGIAIWIIAITSGWALSMYFGRRAHAKPGASTLGNRTAAAVWFAVGIFVTGFWLTLMVVHDNFTDAGVPPYFLFGLMFPMAFGLFGVAFFATAAAARVGWMRWISFIAWVCAALSLALMDSVHQSLVGGVGTLLCSALPGFILMRNEPSEVV
ncbi:MAG: hypothetical protein AAF936_12295 [Pseudomonadota bacterium]